MSMKRTIVTGGIGLVLGIAIAYFIPNFSSNQLPQPVNQAKAQKEIDQLGGKVQAISISKDVLDAIKALPESKAATTTYLYYGEDPSTTTFYLVNSSGQSGDGYYNMPELRKGVIICPPICDFHGPLKTGRCNASCKDCK